MSFLLFQECFSFWFAFFNVKLQIGFCCWSCFCQFWDLVAAVVIIWRWNFRWAFFWSSRLVYEDWNWKDLYLGMVGEMRWFIDMILHLLAMMQRKSKREWPKQIWKPWFPTSIGLMAAHHGSWSWKHLMLHWHSRLRIVIQACWCGCERLQCLDIHWKGSHMKAQGRRETQKE